MPSVAPMSSFSMTSVGTGSAPALSSLASVETSLFRELAVDHPVVGDDALDRRVADELLVEEDAQQLAHVVAGQLGELARVLGGEVHLRLAAGLAEAGRGALELGAAVDDLAGILVRAVGVAGVLLVGSRPGADLRRHDLELEHRGLFEQAHGGVGVFDRRQLDEQLVAAHLGDDGLGDTQRVDADLDDLLDLVLDVRSDLRDLLGRRELEQHACAALEIEAEVDLLLHREDGPHAETDQNQEKDRLKRPLELIPHTGFRGKGRTLGS